jgi:hypothetical protein
MGSGAIAFWLMRFAFGFAGTLTGFVRGMK